MINRGVMNRQMFANGGLVQATEQLKGLRQNMNSTLDNVIGGNGTFGGSADIFARPQPMFQPLEEIQQPIGLGALLGDAGSFIPDPSLMQNTLRSAAQNFANGGEALPKGYHRMPDGTVMKDTAHMSNGGEAERASPPSYMYSPTEPRSVVEKFPDIYTGPKAIPLREMPSNALMQVVASDASSSDEIMDAILELERRGFDRFQDIPMVTGRNYGAPGGAEGEPQRAVAAREPDMPIFNRGYVERLEQQRAGTRNVAASEDIPFEDRYFEPAEFRYGGDVKKMQMGGEPMAAPSATPADMSGIAGMLSQAEQSTAQGTEQLGAEYAQNMMAGIEGAEDFKTMIDSIRGNDVPIQARYEELAGYVGPQDAQQTPESVLAMVQPTIMMTEEGAMGSGIGELMQGIAGSVEMETAGGQPTAMGQGVGSMLMASAQEPVQAFRYGGVVQKFNVGGVASANDPALHEAFYAANVLKPGFAGQAPLSRPQPAAPASLPSLESLYEKSLPLYEKVLGQDQQSQDQSKAQILFDVARRGLAFAGGVNPDTGESMADKSLASQFAIASQTLPTVINEQLAEKRKLSQGIKLGALDAAQGQYTAALEAQLKKQAKMSELEYQRGTKEMELEAKANEPVKLGPTDTLRNPKTGEVIAQGVGTTDYEPVRVQFADSTLSDQVFNQKDPRQQKELNALLESSPGSFPVSEDKAKVTPDFLRQRSSVFNDTRLRTSIAEKTAGPEDIRQFSQAIIEYTQPSTVEKVTDQGVQKIKRPGNPLDIDTAKFIREHLPELAAEVFKQTGQYTDPRVVKFGLGRDPEFLTTGMNEEKAREIDDISYGLGIDVFDPSTGIPPLEEEQVFPSIDYGKAFGLPGKINLAGNKLFDLVSSDSFDEEAIKARSYLQKFNLGLTVMASETYPGSRPPVFFLEQFENLKVRPESILFGDVEAYQSINTLIDFIKSDMVTMRQSAFGPTDDKTKKQARLGLQTARETLAQAIVIRNGMEQSLGLSPSGAGAGTDANNLDRFIK